VTEIHHFPDSGIADIFYQLAVDEALELHVAGEAQVSVAENIRRSIISKSPAGERFAASGPYSQLEAERLALRCGLASAVC
jgi:hypothetical protein